MDPKLLAAITELLNVKEIAAFMAAYFSDAYLWQTLFPAKKQQSRKLEFVKGANNLPVLMTQGGSNVISTPLAFDGFSAYADTLPGYKNNVALDMELAQQLAVALVSKDDLVKDQVVIDILKKFGVLYANAMATCEYMALQLLTTGAIALPSGRNMDYMLSANQKETLLGSAMWSDTANSKPLNDIERWRMNMELEPTRAVISRLAFADLCQNQQILNEFKSVANQGFVNGEDVKAYISRKFNLELTVHDKRWKTAGSSAYMLSSKHFILFGDEPLGEMRFAASDSEVMFANSADFSLVGPEGTFALLTETKKDPAGHKVILDMLAAPSGEGLNDMFIGKVG